MANNIASNADVEVSSIILNTPSGKALDITNLVTEINIFEDLFSPIITGNMVIVDGGNLFSATPVLGQEILTGIIKQGEQTHDFEFRATGIENVAFENDFTLSYKIQFVEESYFVNATTLISQSYEGSISTIIKRIVEDYLFEEIEVEETVGNFKVVIPNWNPYKAIRWLMRRAHNENNVPMVCYKTLYNGMQLRSLETLYGQEAEDVFFYRKKGDSNITDVENFRSYMQTPKDFSQKRAGDMIDLLNNGAYASRTQLVDTMNKNYSIFDYSYKDEFEKIDHLGPAKFISDNFLVDDKSIYEHYQTTQKNFIHSGQSFGDSHFDYNGDVLNSAPHLTSYIKTMSTVEYYLIISGRRDIQVGSVIDLDLNQNKPFTRNEISELNDKRRSGKHIVTALRHKFDGNRQYNLVLDVARDTMGADYDEAI